MLPHSCMRLFCPMNCVFRTTTTTLPQGLAFAFGVYEDIVQLEWLSNFVQDSLSKVRAPPICHAKRARSKRPRPATFNPRAAIQLIPPLKKSLGSLNRQSHNENSIKKCTHCQVTTTAMWRGGPNGPRTLCNACGLRYGLGRLCPEYRPGARVSFMSSHSPHSDPLKKRPEQPSKKQKIRPLCGGTDRQSHNQNEDPNAHPWRMCTSCQSTENLQWRASKYGPKMICSACRCRNKSNQSVARPTFNPFEASQFVPSTYILDTSPSKKTLEQPKCKKKAKSSPLSGVSNGQSQNQKDDSSAKPRVKCSHCEVTHSSQWRKGPNGPGTLCNACGIRYRSGKLLPEYRPVASPTFVPSVHSNSHRKVIEIRSSKNHEETTSCKPELLPYSIFDKDAPEQEDAVLAIPSSMPELLPYSISDKDTPEQEDAILAVPSSMPELLPYSMSDKDAPEQEDAILAEPISMPELLPYSISDNDTPEQEDAILAVPSSMPELLPYSISDQDTPEQENAIQAVPSFTPELTPNSAFGDKLPETRNSTNTMDESLMTEVPIIFHPELLQMCNIVSNQD